MVFAKRTESIKFGEFMTGEYKSTKKEKTTDRGQITSILKGVATASLIVTTSKVAIPALMVSIPIAMITSKTALAATNVVPMGQAIEVGAIPNVVKEKIMHSFDPLIDLMVGVSLPIAGVMLTAGALLIMVGQKETGMKLIMNSALGYVLVQMSPLFISLLAGVGSAI